MNEFDLIHKQITALAKKRILDKYIRIAFDDLVNEAYLRVLEAKKELTLGNLTAQINTIAGEYLNENSNYNEKEINETQFRFCKRCNEDKPVAAFGVTIRRKTGKKVFQSYCAECHREVMKKYKKPCIGIPRKRHSINYPEHLIGNKRAMEAYYHKIWQKENSEKVNAYIKNRYHSNPEIRNKILLREKNRRDNKKASFPM